MTYNTHALDAGHFTLSHRLNQLGKTWWRAYWRRRSERATIALLHSLQDNVLHDIGIDRSEIESVVHTRSRGRLQRFDTV